MSRFDKYMTVPFVHGGRSFNGADCFGLYALVLANEAGLKMPDPGVRFDRDKRGVISAVAAALARGQWHRFADAPRPFDAVVMSGHCVNGNTAHRADVHIGCLIDGRMILHTEEHCGPRVVAIDDPEIMHRVRYFCRPAALLDRAA